MMCGNAFAQFTFHISQLTTVITSADPIGISRFEDALTVMPGVNRTLLIKLTDTNGRVHKQIIKGNKDDLRQDAVMQQLFVLSSRLLKRKNQLLSITNYKVLPLSQISVQHWHYVFRGGPGSSGFFRYPAADTVENEMFLKVQKAFDSASVEFQKPQTSISTSTSTSNASANKNC
jgi:hypothetical protein